MSRMRNKEKKDAPEVKFKSHEAAQRVLKINGVEVTPAGGFKVGGFMTIAIYAT